MNELIPEKGVNGEDDVVVLLSVSIFDRQQYKGMNVSKITPSKIVDDWGVVLDEKHPMVFVGEQKEIKRSVEEHLERAWAESTKKDRSRQYGKG